MRRPHVCQRPEARRPPPPSSVRCLLIRQTVTRRCRRRSDRASLQPGGRRRLSQVTQWVSVRGIGASVCASGARPSPARRRSVMNHSGVTVTIHRNESSGLSTGQANRLHRPPCYHNEGAKNQAVLMTIAARYEDGVFKPLEDVKIKEGTVVEVYLPSEQETAGRRRSIKELPFYGMW